MSAYRNPIDLRAGPRRLSLDIEIRPNTPVVAMVNLLTARDDGGLIAAAWSLPQSDHPWKAREFLGPRRDGEPGDMLHWRFENDTPAAERLATLLMLLI